MHYKALLKVQGSHQTLNCPCTNSVKFGDLAGVYKRKLAPTRVSYRDDFLISYRVYIMTGPFHISLKVHFMLIKYTYKDSKSQTLLMRYPFQSTGDFTPKRVLGSRLHVTVARFRTGVKFLPRYNNRGELTPG